MTMRRPLSALLACFGFAIVCLGPVGSAAEPRCTCRYAGQSYDLGTCVCMKAPGGIEQRVCCGMVLNNTSWEFTGEGCPVARAGPAAPARMRPSSRDGVDAAPKIADTGSGASMAQ